MIPILYEATATSFNDNGLGALPELYDVEVVEKANDLLEFNATYPVSGQRYDDLIEDAIILAKPNSRDDEHAFRISDLELDITGENVVITAYSITNDLGGNLVTDLVISDADGQTAMTNLQNAVESETRFKFVSDITTKSSTHFQMVSPLEAIAGTTGSLLQIWGGEIKRENDQISLLARRGYDDVTTFRLGKNISGLKYAIDATSVVTRIYPYYSKTVDGGTSLIRGQTVDSKYIGNYPYIHIKPVDASQEITVTEDMTDKQIVAAIDAWAKDWFTKSANTGVDKPSVTISLDVLELSGSSELEGKLATLEQLGLFDTVTLFVPEYKIDVTAKVNELHYDPMAGRVTSLVAGTAKRSVFSQQSDTLNSVLSAVVAAKNQADYAAVSANGKNTNFYGDAEPFNPKEGDIWYTTELIDGKKEDVIKTFKNGVWTELVSSATARQVAHEVDAKMAQLDADMSVADANLKVAKQDVADLQVKLKDNDEIQTQLKKDLSANSTILAQAQADIVTNAEDLTALDAKLKANDDAQAQLKNDLEANTKVQDQLANDLADNVKLVNANKESVDAALVTVNETLTQAQADTAAAVKNADLAVTNAQSAVEASGLATNTANSASDAALAAKNLATSTANEFDKVKDQAATAANDASAALGNANDAMGQATTAIDNASDALTQAKSALATASSVQTSMQPTITTAVDKAKGELTASIQTVKNTVYGIGVGAVNLAVKATEANCWINASGSVVSSDGVARTTDFIKIESSGNYVLQYWYQGGHHQWLGWTFYDSEKTFINYISNGESDPETSDFYLSIKFPNQRSIPNNATYIRISYYEYSGEGKIQFEKGTIATSFSVAPEDVQSQITTNSTDITANSKEIALAAKQSTVDTLAKQVTDNTSQLKLTATAASLEVTSKKVDALSQTVTNQGAKLDLTATSAQLKVTDNKVDALNKTVSDNSAQLKLTATSAALETQSKRVDTISGNVDTNTAAITAANGEIELKANNSRVDTLSNTVKQQGIDLKAAQGQLALKITQNDLTKGLDGYATEAWAQNQITATAKGWETQLSTVQAQYNDIGQSQGRNYIRNSRFDNGLTNWSASTSDGALTMDTTSASQTNLGKPGLHIFGTTTSRYQGIAQTVDLKLKKGQKFVIGLLQSFDGLPSQGTLNIGVHYRDASNAILSQEWHDYTCDSGWNDVYRRNSIVYTVADDCDNMLLMIYVIHENFSLNAYLTEVSLTVGPTSFGWQPAPEDSATYTDAKVADLKLTVDGLTATFAKQKDLEKATSDFKVTADGLNLVTAVTGTNGENVTQVIADVHQIQTTMTGPNGVTTRLQTLEGFQQTATDNIKGIQTQQTMLAGQYTSLIESSDNKVRKPWFDDDQAGTWSGERAVVAGPDSNVQNITGHSKYLKLLGRDNFEDGVGWFSVTPGEVYYFSGYMGSWGTTYPVNVGLMFVTEGETYSWIPAAGFPANSKTQISAITGSITVPSGVVRAQTWVQIDGPNGADLGYAAISGLRISKSASNSQITQLQNAIDLRVNVDGKIAAALNLSADGGGTVTIRGASLYVTADSHFDNASIRSASIASLDATKITSGSISSDRLATTKLNADNITSGSISADRLATTKLNASNITSGSINAGLITTGVLSADMIVGGTFDASKMTVKNINAGSITSGSIATALLASTKINADNITSGTIAAARIATTSLSATNITSGTLDVSKLTVKNLSADLIASGTIDASKITVKNLSASNIIGGTFDGSKMTVKNIDASSINTGTLNAANLNVVGLNASAITTGTIKGANLAINLNTGQVVFQSGRIHSTTDNIDINIDKGYMSVADSTSRVLLKGGQLQFVQPQLFDLQTSPYLSISNDGVGSNWAGATIVGRDSIMLANSANLGDTFTLGTGQNTFSGLISGKNSNGKWMPTLVGGANRGVVISGGTAFTSGVSAVSMPMTPFIHVGTDPTGMDDNGTRIMLYGQYVYSPSTYMHTMSGSANVIVASDGALVRTSSATKYKSNIERFRSTDMGETLLSLPQAHWYNKQDMQRYADDPQHYSMPELDYGMIAEDLAAAGLEDLVVRGDDGQLEDIRYDRMTPALLPLLAKMKQEIEELKSAAKSA